MDKELIEYKRPIITMISDIAYILIFLPFYYLGIILPTLNIDKIDFTTILPPSESDIYVFLFFTLVAIGAIKFGKEVLSIFFCDVFFDGKKVIFQMPFKTYLCNKDYIEDINIQLQARPVLRTYRRYSLLIDLKDGSTIEFGNFYWSNEKFDEVISSFDSPTIDDFDAEENPLVDSELDENGIFKMRENTRLILFIIHSILLFVGIVGNMLFVNM
jgi:hypothetical protein